MCVCMCVNTCFMSINKDSFLEGVVKSYYIYIYITS